MIIFLNKLQKQFYTSSVCIWVTFLHWWDILHLGTSYIQKEQIYKNIESIINKNGHGNLTSKNGVSYSKRQLKLYQQTQIFFGISSLIVWALIFPRKVIVSQQMPEYHTIFWQFMLFMLIEDCTSTLTHTLLHSPQLYWIHKKHHQYTTTVSIAAEYAHPIEFIISNSLPTIIGFKFLAYFYPVHIVTAITWLIYRILLTSDLHSGYEFPWDFYKLLPFTAPASYHDYHHSHNVGNFASSFMLIQALLGHNKEYYKYIQNKQKYIEIQEKSNEKMKDY